MSGGMKAFRTLNARISSSGSACGGDTSGAGSASAGASGGGDTTTTGNGDGEAGECAQPGQDRKGASNLRVDRCDVALPALIPPFRFACVEQGIYRGAHPSLLNLRFLTRLQLRTVISLLPPSEVDAPSPDLVEFCAAYGIAHHAYSLKKYDDGFSHTPQLVAQVLALLVDADKLPLFIHCMDGRQNTGIVLMCLRKMQNWGLKPIVDEFSRYTKDASFEYAEQNFVQRFDVTQVVLPNSVPPWFLHRVRLVSPPSGTPASQRPDVPAQLKCTDVNSLPQ